ncbi:MAG: hypothetical protein JSU74_05785 [Candidatus Zixiibacteriota bacterium]|nr:MAG: hypothetical protein JSU74_05785 [candidate division Zixibacteria bacterium]
MRFLWALVAVFLSLPLSVAASGFIELSDEIRIPLADGWHLVSDSADYPYQIVRDDQSAEILIFKSIIEAEEAVNNEQELKLSVDEVINDVILSLPDAQLLTNTGRFDQNRVWFDLDFVSRDEDSDTQIRHRLKGILYRHPDGYQLLFSIWAKAAEGASASALYEMRLMQEEFSYIGDAESRIFGVSNTYDWYLIGFLFAVLIVMLFVLKRRRERERIAFSDEANFWRCSCGRLNHNEFANCRRCGRPKQTETVS